MIIDGPVDMKGSGQWVVAELFTALALFLHRNLVWNARVLMANFKQIFRHELALID